MSSDENYRGSGGYKKKGPGKGPISAADEKYREGGIFASFLWLLRGVGKVILLGVGGKEKPNPSTVHSESRAEGENPFPSTLIADLILSFRK